MHSLYRIVFFLGLLASLISAAPSAVQKRSFKVERVRNANFKGHNGPRQLLKTYMKYHMRPPQELVDFVNTQAVEQTTAGAPSVQQKAAKGKGKGKKAKAGAKGKGKAGAAKAKGKAGAAAKGKGKAGGAAVAAARNGTASARPSAGAAKTNGTTAGRPQAGEARTNGTAVGSTLR